MGVGRILNLPQRATWIATGNNIRLGGDMARRCYWVRMDAKRSRPWQRTSFKHPDLMRWVEDNRGHLLAALLTLARAWFAAGRPPANTPILGGFTEWASTCGESSIAGISGFLDNLKLSYEQIDDDTQEWEAFFRQNGFEYTRTSQLPCVI